MNVFQCIRRLFSRGELFVTMDPRDNSITFSRPLFRYIRRHVGPDEHEGRVLVFRTQRPQGKQYAEYYAFSVNPPLEQEAALPLIMSNDRLHCIGFESLRPTVNRIFFDYDLHPRIPARLSVIPERAPDKTIHYIIERPVKISLLWQK